MVRQLVCCSAVTVCTSYALSDLFTLRQARGPIDHLHGAGGWRVCHDVWGAQFAHSDSHEHCRGPHRREIYSPAPKDGAEAPHHQLPGSRNQAWLIRICCNTNLGMAHCEAEA